MDLLLFSYSYLSVGVVSVRQGGGGCLLERSLQYTLEAWECVNKTRDVLRLGVYII